MARGKADRQLTVGKKLEIIEEADRTGLVAVTAQKYGVKTGQIRDWKKNIDRLRATDPSRLVCASTIQRGHLVFNETYAQYWVGYNKFCSNHTNYDVLKETLRQTQKELTRDGINAFGFPTMVDPTTTHSLECPSCSSFFMTDEVQTVYQKDMISLRAHLKEFYENKPFPTKFIYFVTRLDFYKPTPAILENTTQEDQVQNEHGMNTLSMSSGDLLPNMHLHGENANVSSAMQENNGNTAPTAPVLGEDGQEIGNYISVYVAICGNGSVMVPMATFPPVEPWHWERKKAVKLRHAHSVHRTKKNDPKEALQFFSVTWKKFYDEEAKYNDKFVFLLDATLDEFRSSEFHEGLKQLEGYEKYWTTYYTVRNPLKLSRFEEVLSTFVNDEWKKILAMKKSAQPNDFRKCVAFWFYTAWEYFAGEHARTAFRCCNMYLENIANVCAKPSEQAVQDGVQSVTMKDTNVSDNLVTTDESRAAVI